MVFFQNFFYEYGFEFWSFDMRGYIYMFLKDMRLLFK